MSACEYVHILSEVFSEARNVWYSETEVILGFTTWVVETKSQASERASSTLNC